MGRPKAGLPIGDRADTFLSRILRTFAAAGLPDIVVVTGAAPAQVHAAAGRVRRNVRFAHNERWETGQLSSLHTGLRAYPGDDIEAAVVTLIDTPLVAPATVKRLLEAWRRTHAPIVRPARGGVHGHPVIFDRSLFAELHAASPQVGAKAVVRAHAAHILNVAVDDAGAFVDIDTEREYEEALRELRR